MRILCLSTVFSALIRRLSRIELALRSLVNGSLFAEAVGVGQPRVLALHGWGRRGSDFAHSLAGFGALAMDLPGFGATPPPDAAIGAREYASLLLPVLDEFDAPPLVVGHSFGGRVAVCLAAQHPGRVAGLLVTGAPLLRLASGKNPPLAYRIARSLNRYGLVSDRSMETMKRKRGSADYRAASGVMRDVLVKVVNEDYRDELSGLANPIHLLWGGDDREVPVAVAHEAAKLVAESGGIASVEVLEGVGHMLPIQDPDSLRVAVGKMLR